MIKKYYLFIFCLSIMLPCSISQAETVLDRNRGGMTTGPENQFFYIQVASFKKAGDAEKQVSFLQVKGVKSFSVQEEAGRKGKWYRVYLGRYSTAQEAKSRARELVSGRIISSYWIKRKTFRPAGLEISRPVPEAAGQDKPVESAHTGGPETPAHPSRPAMIDTPPTGESGKNMEQANTAGYLQLAAVSEKEKKQGGRPQENDKKWVNGPLSIGFRAGINNTPNADDFYILSGGSVYKWEFSENRILATLTSTLNLTDSFFLEAGVGRAFDTDLDYWFLSLGPKFYPARFGALSPYVRAGVLWGDLSWDIIPGDFGKSFGFEGGAGLEYVRQRYRLGADISYRSLEFDYEPPPGVVGSRNSIDFSGFSLMGTLTCFF